MIVVKNLTQLIRYQEIQLSNNFFELLTATVSHEMMTPLNAILSLIQNSIRKVEKGAEVLCRDLNHHLQELKIINSSCNTLHSLVNDMVDLFQLKNKRFKTQEKNIEIRKCLEEIVEIIRIPSQQKGLRIQCQADQSLPRFLKLDSKRLKQIMMNLLQNAVKFTYQGVIEIQLHYDEATEYLVGQVKDTGIGISEEDQKSLFQVFGKLKNTESINTSGIGLGLYICRQLCKALKGDIKLLDSQVSMGTCFQFKIKAKSAQQSISSLSVRHYSHASTISIANYESSSNLEIRLQQNVENVNDEENPHPGLIFRQQSRMENEDSIGPSLNIFIRSLSSPKIQESNSEEHKSIPVNCPCQNRASVLIVDDNIFNVYAVQTMIENFQNSPNCDTALNGLIGFEKVQKREEERRAHPCICGKEKSNYSLILMDCNMPVMDGFQATIKIREYLANLTQQPMIVALTAYNTQKFEEKCFQSGMDQFLTKPVDLGEIEQLLANLKLI
ncbi:hypothetical protein FGO68_gene11933 [Halteria grandinella]|uniref:Histidine kinase n=1 Tax=Halteria grandinella TaxID=5974 RepID=A0A8J8P1N6_HALGN|nr:hypothetical protein FGO68_gene11933 [Halteria grandinella]